jgi:hypothetical protein
MRVWRKVTGLLGEEFQRLPRLGIIGFLDSGTRKEGPRKTKTVLKAQMKYFAKYADFAA